MATINDGLREAMEKAVGVAEIAVGQKAVQMVLVTERESPIHYQFGVGFDIGPADNLAPKTVTDAIEVAFKTVGEFIAGHCQEHFVRVVPEINTERHFDTNATGYRGYMRGTMVDVGEGAGPAKIRKPESAALLPVGFGDF